jgi:class 3 adenylate cyclase
VLRTAIESHDGFLFSRTGDGVVAAFNSPKSAVDPRNILRTIQITAQKADAKISSVFVVNWRG